tara:strand:+ start:692 stop:1579 length:888 start_codon:yes stop_codon:yes gene_type:complete
MSQESGNSVQDMVIGTDSSNFFDRLEEDVNGGIVDAQEPEETLEEPEVALTSESDEIDPRENYADIWEDDSNPYKKRYSDSSKEGKRLYNENKELESLKEYEPLIDILKKDKGAVENLRSYLKGEIEPASVKERLGVDEDFVFDPDEAFADPNSQSAKVFNNMVSNIVDSRVNAERQRMEQEAAQQKQLEQSQIEFQNYIQSKGYTDEQAEDLQRKAAEHTLSWQDIDFLVNKDNVKNNIAQNTKKQMMNQLKKAQSAPQTASKSGNADSADMTHEDAVFNAIKGVDDVLDNLFE